jgi:hypothetical protein
MSKLAPEVRDAIQAKVDKYPTGWISGFAGYTIFDKTSPKPFRTENNGGCHYYVGYSTPGQIVVNAHKPNLHGANKEFTLAVARDMPFSHGVLNRSNEDEILKHASVIDVDLVGPGGALWLCKAFRYNVEDTFRIPTWNKLMAEGLKPFQAFIGASILDFMGNAQYGTTHNSLFGYGPPDELRKSYDEFQRGYFAHSQVSRSHYWSYSTPRPHWGDSKSVKVKQSDGWGGFIESTKPGSMKEFAAKLKEIFEGDPSNVK